MSQTRRAGTDLSREILGEVMDERGSNPKPPGTTLARKVQAAIDQGASLDELRRHFHLSESELRDYCSDIMDDEGDEGDEGDEDWSGSASGY